jgi:hypothetical protein
MGGPRSLVVVLLGLLVCTGSVAPLVVATSGPVGDGPGDASVGQPSAGSAVTDADSTPTETGSTAETSGDGEVSDGDANQSVVAEKVSPALLEGSGRLRRSPAEAASGAAAAQSVETSERLPVVVELVPDAAERGRAAVERAVGPDAVVASHGRYVQASATREEVTELAANSLVSYVRPPSRPVSLAGSDGTTEGIAAVNLSAARDGGYTGENVTVAVVDVDPFDVDHPAFSGRVAATKDFTGRDVDGEGGHGTATAELVAETAPNASLVFVRVNSEVELYEAIDWLEANTSTDVVSMSLGWYNVGALNGTSPMDREIEESVENGTTWVVSAGNTGNRKHWNGTWTDPDGDGRLNVDGDREHFEVVGTASNGHVPVRIYASWRDWPRSDDDYDICLYDDESLDDADLVGCSGNPQTGIQDPAEGLVGYLSDDGDGYERLYLTVERRDADGRAHFDVFLGDSLTFRRSWTTGGSLAVPATNPRVVTVGAVDHVDGRIEPYSSRGPTVDGRTKPDVVAPDNVSSSVYDRFRGTSASAPQVAGVAAVLLDANRRLSAAEVKSSLLAGARPLGDGVTQAAGHGLVDAERSLAGLDEYDLPPDGRLRFDGRYRLATGGNAAPASLVVSADEAVVDGGGRAFAGDGAAAVVTADAGTVRFEDARLTAETTSVEVGAADAVVLRNLSLDAQTALSVDGAESLVVADSGADGRVEVEATDAATLENGTVTENATVSASNGSVELVDARFERALEVSADGDATVRNVTVAGDGTVAANGSLDVTDLAVGDRPAFGVAGRDVRVDAGDDVSAPGDAWRRWSAAPTVRKRAGGSATVTLRYDPGTAAESSATVWVRRNGTWTETDADVDLKADVATVEDAENGTYAVFAEATPDIDAPERVRVEAAVGSTSTVPVTISNGGTANFTIAEVTIAGADADQFDLATDPAGTTVTPGNETTVSLAFSPNRSGRQVASIAVSTTGDRAVVIDLLGLAEDGEPTESETETAAETTTSQATPGETPTGTSTSTPTGTSTPAEEPAEAAEEPSGGGESGDEGRDEGGNGSSDDGESGESGDDGSGDGGNDGSDSGGDDARDSSAPEPTPEPTPTATSVTATPASTPTPTPTATVTEAVSRTETPSSTRTPARQTVGDAADAAAVDAAAAGTDAESGHAERQSTTAETTVASATETELPGFGAASVVAALLGAGAVSVRRRSRRE